MMAAEARVGELEEALKQSLVEFESMSNEFTECAEKLAGAEEEIKELRGKNEVIERELEGENEEKR